MKCGQSEKLIALFVEGDLPEKETPELELHLTVCPNCRCLVEDFRESQTFLKSWGSESIDPAMFRAVREGVLKQIELHAKPRAMRRLGLYWTSQWKLVTVAGLLLSLGVAALWQHQVSSKHSKESARSRQGVASGPAVGAKATESQARQDATKRLSSLPAKDSAESRAKAQVKHPQEKSVPSVTQPDRLHKIANSKKKDPLSDAMVEIATFSRARAPLETQPVPSETAQVIPDGFPQLAAEATSDPLVIQFLTDDPNIVIVWLAEKNGG